MGNYLSAWPINKVYLYIQLSCVVAPMIHVFPLDLAAMKTGGDDGANLLIEPIR